MGCIALVRCVLVLRYGIRMQAEALLQPASGYHIIGQPGVDLKHFRYVRYIEVTV